MDILVDSSDSCRRCGSAVYGFSKKMAASDGLYYCIKCAEHLDKKYLIENTCSFCAKTFIKGEVKFVAPSKVYSASPLPLEKRLVCVNCYRRFATRSRIRAISPWKLRLNFRRSATRGLSGVFARI